MNSFIFHSHDNTLAVIAALLHKLGDNVTFTQADFDAIAALELREVGDDKSITFSLHPLEGSQNAH